MTYGEGIASLGGRQSIAQKGVRAFWGEKPQLEMARALPKPAFALPGCQQTSVNSPFV